MRKMFTLATILLVAGFQTATSGIVSSMPGAGHTLPEFQSRQQAVVRLDEPAVQLGKAASQEENGIITDVEGVRHTYYTAGHCYSLVQGVVMMQGMADGVLTEIVEGKGNEIYILNPFSKLVTDSYMKGERTGDIVTFKLPQALYTEAGEVYYANYMHKAPKENGNMWYEPVDEADNVITYKIQDGKWMMQGTAEGEYILGLASKDGKWSYFGDYGISYQLFEQEPETAPQDVPNVQWAMTYNNTGKFVDVKNDNGTIWIQGIANALPTGWVKGHVKDGKVEFRNFQYLGYSENLGVTTFFAGAIPVYEWNESLQRNEVVDYQIPETILMDYDAASNTISTKDVVMLSASLDQLYAIEMYEEPMFRLQPADISLIPVKPEITFFMPFDPAMGFGGIIETISNLNADGYLLDADNMYYRYLLDNEPHVFTPEDIEGLEEDMELVPFNFNDMLGMILATGTEHQWIFMFEGFDNIGVQSVYVDSKSGEEYVSEIATMAVSGISGTTSDKTVSTEWYDLQGNRVSRPSKGIYIQKTITADGNTNARKIMF